MIIQTVVQNAISRARRRSQRQSAARTVQSAGTEIPQPKGREALGVLVVVVLVLAFAIGAFIAAR